MFNRLTVSGAVGDFGTVNDAGSARATSSSRAKSIQASTQSSGGSADSQTTQATSVTSAPAVPPTVTRASNSDPIVHTLSTDAWGPAAKLSNASAAAAHLTLASASLQAGELAPFSIPSPDKELTDPMDAANDPLRRRVVKKGSMSSETGTSSSGAQRQRSQGHGFVNGISDHPAWQAARGLPTIAGSPLGTPAERKESSYDLAGRSAGPPTSMVQDMLRVPPASAPVDWTSPSSASKSGTSDYFGSATVEASQEVTSRPATLPHQISHSSHASSTATVTLRDLAVVDNANRSGDRTDSPSADGQMRLTTEKPRLEKHSSHGNVSKSPAAMANSRAGLFVSHEAPAALGLGRVAVESSFSPAPSVAVPEDSFEEKGYLMPPSPPNELARRKALYRYDILHTAPDANFDRIAHLAKLVFRSKIVMIVLVDDDKQFHKVEGGLGASETPRVGSICAHTILAKWEHSMILSPIPLR